MMIQEHDDLVHTFTPTADPINSVGWDAAYVTDRGDHKSFRSFRAAMDTALHCLELVPNDCTLRIIRNDLLSRWRFCIFHKGAKVGMQRNISDSFLQLHAKPGGEDRVIRYILGHMVEALDEALRAKVAPQIITLRFALESPGFLVPKAGGKPPVDPMTPIDYQGKP